MEDRTTTTTTTESSNTDVSRARAATWKEEDGLPEPNPEVTDNQDTQDTVTQEKKQISCSVCDGRGFDSGGNDCSTCGGSGNSGAQDAFYGDDQKNSNVRRRATTTDLVQNPDYEFPRFRVFSMVGVEHPCIACKETFKAKANETICPSCAGVGDCMFLYVSGDKGGAGKTTVCLAILSYLLNNGYSASELAYIKPTTQCKKVQLLWKFCEDEGIEHCGVGPIVFYQGYTKECIDGKHGTDDDRLASIWSSVKDIAEGKKIVLVDGVGYPAVGSLAGISNAHVASYLGAPVIIVGRDGLGNAVDSTNMIISYFESFQCEVLGGLYNKIPAKSTYHSPAETKRYVTKYFEQNRPGHFSVYGHVPMMDVNSSEPEEKKGDSDTDKPNLELSSLEREMIEKICEHMAKNCNFDQMLEDVKFYYQNGGLIPNYKKQPPVQQESTGMNSRISFNIVALAALGAGYYLLKSKQRKARNTRGAKPGGFLTWY